MRARTTSGLLVLTLAILGLVAGFEREGSRDFHWHLVLGEQTLHAGGPVRTEQFSYTNPGGRVFVSAWLADVLLALSFRLGGYAGSQLLRGLCISTLLVFLWLHARRRGASPWACSVLVLVTLAGALPRLFLRPEMFAFAAGSVLLWLLDVHEQARDRRVRVAALGGVLVTIALWANLHGSVIVGLVAVGLYAAEQAVRNRRDRAQLVQALALPVAAFAAACLNPEGARLPLAFRIVSPNFSAYITEWQPLARGFVQSPIAVMGTLALATTVLVGRRVSPWRIGLAVVLSLLSIRYHRFLSYLLFSTVPLIADNLRKIREDEAASSGRGARVVGLGLLIGGGVFALVFLVMGRGLPGRVGIGTEPGIYPEAACAFARQAHLPGRMLNSYDSGDYLLYCLPGQQVFIDQRAWSAYPDALYGQYLQAMESPQAVRALADQYETSWAFLSDTDPLAEQMASDPDTWRLLYFDDQALIYARADKGAARDRLEGSFRFLNPLNLTLVLSAPSAALPRIREEVDRQAARCPGCWRTSMVRAAFALASADGVEFDRAIASMPPPIRERREVVFLRARQAMATRRFLLAAALYGRLRKIGRNPVGAATLQADALMSAGDVGAARRVVDEIAAMPEGAAIAAQLRAQLPKTRPR